MMTRLPLILAFCGCCFSAFGATVQLQQDTRKQVLVDWKAQLDSTLKQLEKQPNSSVLHSQAAMTYDALNDFENFDREIQLAIKLDSANTMPCYMAYAVYRRRGISDKQSSVLDAALRIDPANPFGHYEKAATLEDGKNWQGALKEYQTAQQLLQRVKSDPKNLHNGSWTYVDPRSNSYDVTSQLNRISDDLTRVRKEIGK